MKPTGFNNLSAEDATVIHELAPILDIVLVKAIGASERKFILKQIRVKSGCFVLTL